MARFPFVMLSIRNIKRSKMRSYMLLAGVALTVSLQIGIAISVDSLKEDFIQTNRNHNYTDITMYGEENQTLADIRAQIPQIQDSFKVEGVSPAVTLNLSTLLQLPNDLGDTYIYGITTDHPDFSRFDRVAGSRSLENNKILMSEEIARLYLLDPEDNFVMDAVPSEHFLGGSFVVSAIIDEAYPFGNRPGAYIVFEIDYLLSLFDDTSSIEPYIAMMVPDLLKLNDIANELNDAYDDYIIIREKNIDELKATGLRTYSTAMTVLIIASYAIEFLFITNIFGFSMKERSREFGILRSVGTGKRQVVLLILTEAFLIGLGGSLIGGVAGLGFATFLLMVFRYTLGVSSLSSLVISPTTFGMSLFTGITVTILSGLWPLWIAMSMPVVQTIHSARIFRKSRRRFITWKSSLVLGVLLVGAGFITMSVIEESSFLGFEIGSTQAIVIAAIFLGTLAIEGALVTFVPKIAIRVLVRSTKAPMLLATKDIQRDMQKAMITIFTAALSLSLILIVSMVSSGLFDAVPAFYEESFGDNLNIVIETWDHLEKPNDFTETLKADLEWIQQTSFIQEQRSSFEIGGNLHYFGVDRSSIAYFVDEFITSPSEVTISNLLDDSSPNVVVTDAIVEKFDLALNDQVWIGAANGTNIRGVVSGILHGNPFIRNGEYIFIDTVMFQELWGKDTSKWFWGDYDESFPKVSVVRDIEANYPELKSVMTIFDYHSMIKASLGVQGSFIQLIFVHSFFLSGLTQFIAILVSTIRMERDVAITRSIGMSTRRVFFVFLFEASVLGFTGVILGIFNSFLGAELISWYIGQSIPVDVSINSLVDTAMFILWVGLAGLVTLASTWVPARRASQTNIIAAISGRKELKTARSFYKPAEFDIDAVIEKMQTTPEHVEEVQTPQKTVVDSVSSDEIKKLQEKISSLTLNLDMSIEENQKWQSLYETQSNKYSEGQIDTQRYIAVLRRYLNFLEKV